MSKTHDRAEQILHEAEQDANAYADRVGGDFRTARSYELGLLRGAIRDLCIELEPLQAKRQARLPAIDSPSMDLTTYIEPFAVTDESRDAGAFARSTGAADALRGRL